VRGTPRYSMYLNETLSPVGHLEVIKRYPSGEEEVVFEEYNVICSGLGQSIAQYMSLSDCGPSADKGLCETIPGLLAQENDVSWDGVQAQGPLSGLVGTGSPCTIGQYQITRFQVGTGASSVDPSCTLALLGAPLELVSDYRSYGLGTLFADIDTRTIYANEWTPLVEQVTVDIFNHGIVEHEGEPDAIVYQIILNRNSCNGFTLNEIGIFVDNPFNFFDYRTSGQPDAVTGEYGPVAIPTEDIPPSCLTEDPRIPAQAMDKMSFEREAPGSLLAAYRQFPNITKEPSFDIIFRWSIRFLGNCEYC